MHFLCEKCFFFLFLSVWVISTAASHVTLGCMHPSTLVLFPAEPALRRLVSLECGILRKVVKCPVAKGGLVRRGAWFVLCQPRVDFIFNIFFLWSFSQVQGQVLATSAPPTPLRSFGPLALCLYITFLLFAHLLFRSGHSPSLSLLVVFRITFFSHLNAKGRNLIARLGVQKTKLNKKETN